MASLGSKQKTKLSHLVRLHLLIKGKINMCSHTCRSSNASLIHILNQKEVNTHSGDAVGGDNTVHFCLPDMYDDGSLANSEQ